MKLESGEKNNNKGSKCLEVTKALLSYNIWTSSLQTWRQDTTQMLTTVTI